jgi:hypothetical protein
MKFEYGLIIIVGLLASVSLILIAEKSDTIPYWNYLHEIRQQEFEDGCDINCKKTQENERGYLCTSLDSEQYICRPPRKIFWPDEDVQIRAVFPPTFGEFAYFPENKIVAEKYRLFDIGNVLLVNKETKEIKVDFVYHTDFDIGNYFEYTVNLIPEDTFVSHCLGGDSKTTHIVEYRDIIKLEGKTYVEFWGTHVTLPEELIPCKMPEMIQHSLPIDLRLGIDFGEANED